jgi:hypothetical protein
MPYPDRRTVISGLGAAAALAGFGSSAMADRHVDTKALAALRLGDPVEKLAAAAGSWWRPLRPAEAGIVDYLNEHFSFKAYLDRDNRIARLIYGFRFDGSADIEGVHLGQTEAEIVAKHPDIDLAAPSGTFQYRVGSKTLADGSKLSIQVAYGRVTRLHMWSETAVLPEIGPLPLPRPAQTFDVRFEHGLRPRGTKAPDGWCHGLPRGITQAQWPLSHQTGFPLEHHFTVRVPEPYRTMGPQYVALAFFSESYNGESPRSDAINDLLHRIHDGRGNPKTVSDPNLQPFLDHLKNRHPMDYRAKDILDCTYAMIWLTQQEFEGKECEQPKPIRNALNRQCTIPVWFDVSSTYRIFGWRGEDPYDPQLYKHRHVGRRPLDRNEILLLKVAPVDNDPNAGRTPHDEFSRDPNPDGYIHKYGTAWDALPVKPEYTGGHFGGTVSAEQSMPKLSPFFLEIEELLGDINFGGGNGQLDLVAMKFDWAQ